MRENSKINYNIDEKGYRTLGDQYTTTKIITFGDSMFFVQLMIKILAELSGQKT